MREGRGGISGMGEGGCGKAIANFLSAPPSNSLVVPL
jgi:hypothetical protein